MPEPVAIPPPRAARNAAIHAAEAQFRAHAADIVSNPLRRAHSGDPVCLALCLERALPAGRIPPAIALAPDDDPGNLPYVFGAIGAALDEGRINLREASCLLDALGAPPDRRFAPSGAGSMQALPGVTQVRQFVAIEAGLAKALAAPGLDHFLTVAPRGPGGILENKQTHGPRISSAPFRFAPRCAASGEHTEETS
jgi:hypothetical protein